MTFIVRGHFVLNFKVHNLIRRNQMVFQDKSLLQRDRTFYFCNVKDEVGYVTFIFLNVIHPSHAP